MLATLWVFTNRPESVFREGEPRIPKDPNFLPDVGLREGLVSQLHPIQDRLPQTSCFRKRIRRRAVLSRGPSLNGIPTSASSALCPISAFSSVDPLTC